MIIQHNIMAINSHRQLTVNNANLSKNLEKLSSGYRINKAADDAAGLAISEKMRAQITGLDRAILNAQDGASLIQTAEGALAEVHSMLNRMVELGTQSANGTIQDSDRNKIESELTALKDEIDRISEATNFNGIKLLNGSLDSGAGVTPGTGLAVGVFGTGTTYQTVDEVRRAPTGLPSEFRQNGDGAVRVSANGTKLTFSISAAVAGDPDITKEIDLQDQISVFQAGATLVDLGEFGAYVISSNSAGNTAGLAGELAGQLSVAGVLGSMDASAGGGSGLTMQVGDTADTFNMITVSVEDMSSSGLGIDAISMTNQTNAAAALASVKSAIEIVSVNRGNLGALQNRLEHTINNLGVTSENMTAAESRIRDVDMAKEMMAFTKNNVLAQAAQAMLAQANMQPQQVLQLLR